MDWTPFVAPLVTAIIAASGTYAAVSSRLARLETKMDDLSADVRRHNGVVERTAILERDEKSLWRAVDELKGEVQDLQRDIKEVRK